MKTVAALYVETNGSYYGLEGVYPWDEARDARLYEGPHPIVAHPPCQRWGKMWMGQPLWVKRTGERKIKGDDGGCFQAMIAALEVWGGVAEHHWGSHAWKHFGLTVPPRTGGWIPADQFGNFYTCCVEQGQYGHYARKPTLLLTSHIDKEDLPELKWGHSPACFPPEAIEKYGIEYCKKAGELAFKGGGKDSSARIGTPPEFRDLLIEIARSAK